MGTTEHGNKMADARQMKIACHACRLRKVKCSKDVPRCSNCQDCGQSCVYSSTVHKPGPKTGSIHKRRRVNHNLYETTPEIYSETIVHKSAVKEDIPNTSSFSQNITSQEATGRYAEHIQTVSDLCWPSHISLDPKSEETDHSSHDNVSGNEAAVIAACDALGVSQESMKQMIETFFDVFTSFRLFREPYFFRQVVRKASELQLKALLGAILAFVSKCAEPHALPDCLKLSSSAYAELAIKYIDIAIMSYGDEPIPLCILQALILMTHWLIIKGVRGRAWRYMGLCIRLAFENGLHRIDADDHWEDYLKDPGKWCEDEEGRRAFWAIWEMDQFANHMMKIPITIDWTQFDVCLPAEDQRWFHGQPQRSCFLEPDLIKRSEKLASSGNQSTRAWYIVISSLEAEAYGITYPRERSHRQPKEYFPDRWTILASALRRCMNLLPRELNFHGQNLDFDTRARDTHQSSSMAHIHSAIYQITLMPEIAKLIALRPFVFEAYRKKLESNREKHQDSYVLLDSSARKIDQCYQAADAVLNVVIKCHQNHHRYVTPYITHASWLAATVQILREELTVYDIEKPLIRSKFEILRATNERFVQYWEMPIIPKRNLETLCLRLKEFTAASRMIDARETMRLTKQKSSTGDSVSSAVAFSQRVLQGDDMHQQKTSRIAAEGPRVVEYESDIEVPGPGGGVDYSGEPSLPLKPHDLASRLEANPMYANIAPPATVGPFAQTPANFDTAFEDAVPAQTPNLGSGSLDWPCLFSEFDFSDELADYMNLFSYPFPG